MDVERHLQKFRIADPNPGLKSRVLGAALDAALRPSPDPDADSQRVCPRFQSQGSHLGRYWPVWAAAAAAAVIAVGVAMQAGSRPETDGGATAKAMPKPSPQTPANSSVANSVPKAAASEQVVDLFDGRGQVRVVGSDTRMTVIDAARGRVRLDRGEVLVQFASNTGMQAAVETPGGMAAHGTRFYARYDPGQSDNILTVAVLGDTAAVSNIHGSVIGEADELVVCGSSQAPTCQAPSEPSGGRTWGGIRRGNSAWWLLGRPEVSAELKLSDEQKAALRSAMKEEWGRFAGFSRSRGDAHREEQLRQFAELHRKREKLVADLLNAEQAARLRQIALQQEGLTALCRGEVADALTLSADQRTQVEMISAEISGEMHALYAARERNWEEMGRRKAVLSREAAERIGAVLTAEQSEAWKQMLGEPLSLERRRPTPHRPDDRRGRPDAGRADAVRN